jgi:PhoH-like ATPase
VALSPFPATPHINPAQSSSVLRTIRPKFWYPVLHNPPGPADSHDVARRTGKQDRSSRTTPGSHPKGGAGNASSPSANLGLAPAKPHLTDRPRSGKDAMVPALQAEPASTESRSVASLGVPNQAASRGPKRPASRSGRASNPPSQAMPTTASKSSARAKSRAASAPSAARNAGQDSQVKHFVLDTNILLHNPDAMFVFKEHHVVIPFTVIEELDKMKRKDDDLGRNARGAIRNLDRLRALGKLSDGINWGDLPAPSRGAFSAGPDGNTGTVKIDVTEYTRPQGIDEDAPDNRIIAVAYHLHKQGFAAVFVTKDLSARIKSDALGIKTEDFTNQRVDADRLYTGFLTAEVEGALIDELYRDRLIETSRLKNALIEDLGDGTQYAHELLANQFVVLKDKSDETHTGLGRRLGDTEHVIPVTGPRKPVFGIMARNVQQTMAMDILLDEDIKLITLLGSAGTGKTLLALAAGMTKVFAEERYDKLLVARPIMPLGRDIGYLPGDKDEKLTAWMQPIFDNLTYLLSTRGGATAGDQRGGHADSNSAEQRVQKLMADGKLVLEPLTYIRGRSIPHQFMIVDEAQNLTPHEVKTIASRVGEGTKLILTGDIGQIDNPYLDSSSNGLAYAIEKMKGVRLFAHVTLAKSERSELASLAASRL